MSERKIFDPGNTDVTVLYDFAVRLEDPGNLCLDWDSALYHTYRAMFCAVWDALPGVIVIDLRDPDEVMEV